MKHTKVNPLLVVTLLWQISFAQDSCEGALTPSYSAPAVADGYAATLIADSLTSPRGIKFDSQGALLVVQRGVGISVHTLANGDGDCGMSKGYSSFYARPCS
jgi:hypothetical protein